MEDAFRRSRRMAEVSDASGALETKLEAGRKELARDPARIDEAVKMADRIAIFRAGALVQFAAPDEMLARPADGAASEATKGVARQLLKGIASPFTFYGKLALEELGARLALPPAPAPLTSPERQAALEHPGLQRALQLLSLGLRSEGVREWNFSLRGMGDRELMAAAQMACERQVLDVVALGLAAGDPALHAAGVGVAADRLRGFETAHLRHLHVHEHRVEGLAGDRLDRLPAVPDHRDLVAALGEEAHRHALIDDVVFGQKECRRPQIGRAHV